MHHLAGDMEIFELLFQPSILKIFSEILNEEMELEQYHEDLIMYILNKFSAQVYKKNLKDNAEKCDPCASSHDSPANSCASSNDWFLLEEDNLYWWYLQYEQDNDPISKISEHIPSSKQDILMKLQMKGYLSKDKYKQLEKQMESFQEHDPNMLPKEITHPSNFDEDITSFLRTLVHAGELQHIIWLQNILLETCYVKLGLNAKLPESVPFYSIKMNLSVPLVPYSEEQRMILQNKIFLQLLQKLGLHLGSDNCQMFPRIPLFWTSDMLYCIALRLGPVKQEKFKFSFDDLLSSPYHDSVIVKSFGGLHLPALSSCFTLSSWLTAVQQSKEIYQNTQMKKIFKPNS
ncbi:protein timeless [Caerostris extrusa]|uniref:Protein timeless n=1 Tax=Caerostris extrusa TaxID=172846 RepID=A0AAV4WG83_CAEEX|nr:protein timeless [Caerostris extrusa]